jgi:hypothetical protein
MQTFQLLDKLPESREIIIAGDMNWIEEDHGPCILPCGWYPLASMAIPMSVAV